MAPKALVAAAFITLLPLSLGIEIFVQQESQLSHDLFRARRWLQQQGTPSFTNILAQHNNRRRRHQSTPDLVWNASLAADAQSWARKLADACRFDHGNTGEAGSSSVMRQGENLYASLSSGSNVNHAGNLQAAIDAAMVGWYDQEIQYYSYANPGFSSAAGHFTQVVWKSTLQVGCGAAASTLQCPYNSQPYWWYIVACRYLPPGNVQGQFAANVMPLSSASPGLTPSPTPSATPSPTPTRSPSPAAPGPGSSPAPAPAPPAGSPNYTTILAQHNNRRGRHLNTSSLAWNSTLAAAAQNWATLLAANCRFDHGNASQTGSAAALGQGENLNMLMWSTSTTNATSRLQSAVDASVTAWYDDEIQSYNYSNPTFTPAAGHFTQVVWRNTRQLGCGAAASPTLCRYQGSMRWWYVVACRYSPAGNVRGQFAANVQPLR